MERLGRVTWPVDHDLGGVFSGRAPRELPRYKAYRLPFHPTGRGGSPHRPPGGCGHPPLPTSTLQLLLVRANCRAWKRAVRCSMVKNGTTNAGMMTRGNRFIALVVRFPVRPLIPGNSPEARTPIDTATTKSTIPRIFQMT